MPSRSRSRRTGVINAGAAAPFRVKWFFAVPRPSRVLALNYGAMPKPLIAIVGRPNVGKSTLFNRLAKQRIAVVEDFSGTTRDRLYADCDIWGQTCTLIDTGGFDIFDREGYTPAIVEQAQLAIDEADIIVFLTDGREEPTSLDFEVADLLRRTRKPVILAANKVDNPQMPLSDLYALRLGAPISMSAATGIGVAELTEQIEELLPRQHEEYEADDSIKVALVGRPNVGKSALTNRLLGYERSIVSPVAGTTRDAIDTKLEWKDQAMTLIDTAGMRRKSRVKSEKTSTEYHMVLRSLRAIDRCDVVIIVLEAGGIADQDSKIAGYAHESGKAVLIAVNKWDLIEDFAKPDSKATLAKTVRAEIEKAASSIQGTLKKEAGIWRTLAQKDYLKVVETYLPFISYAPVHFVSADSGYGVEMMFDDALEISKNLTERVPTGVLNDTIRRAMAAHSVPSVKGRQIKIRYATQAEVSPPSIIIFCSHPDLLHFSYVRFLENAIRARFPFRGVPLKIELRRGSGERTKEERLAEKREAGLQETQRQDDEKRLAKAARVLASEDSDDFDDDEEISEEEAAFFEIDDELDGDDNFAEVEEFEADADADAAENENAETFKPAPRRETALEQERRGTEKKTSSAEKSRGQRSASSSSRTSARRSTKASTTKSSSGGPQKTAPKTRVNKGGAVKSPGAKIAAAKKSGASTRAAKVAGAAESGGKARAKKSGGK